MRFIFAVRRLPSPSAKFYNLSLRSSTAIDPSLVQSILIASHLSRAPITSPLSSRFLILTPWLAPGWTTHKASRPGSGRNAAAVHGSLPP